MEQMTKNLVEPEGFETPDLLLTMEKHDLVSRPKAIAHANLTAKMSPGIASRGLGIAGNWLPEMAPILAIMES